MEKLLDHLSAKAALALMSVLILLGLGGFSTARADDERGLDTSHRGERRTGDPLDTNDAGGGDSDDDIHENAAGGSWLAPSFLDKLLHAGPVLIVPVQDGSSITFRFYIMSDASHRLEEWYEK
ncbi:hypothetical protein KDM41_00470 [bacterium]|nr:hypothetical protein [bacterium]